MLEKDGHTPLLVAADLQRPNAVNQLQVVAGQAGAAIFAPERERSMMRALQLRNFSGQLLDEPATLEGAALDVGIDPADLARWVATPEVAERYQADRAVARDPAPAAVALHHKLARWDGGWRYTCPSLRFTRLSDGTSLESPGFQPFETYESNLANLLPDLERAENPESVEEVLRWAGEPLATEEVARVCAITRDEARARLTAAGAQESRVGSDSYWQ